MRLTLLGTVAILGVTVTVVLMFLVTTRPGGAVLLQRTDKR
jgi:hypothetical protein